MISIEESIIRLTKLRDIFANAEPIQEGKGYIIDLGEGKVLFDIWDWEAIELDRSIVYGSLNNSTKDAVDHSCKTACCVAGTAAIHPAFFVDGHSTFYGDYMLWMEESFGLTPRQVECITLPSFYDGMNGDSEVTAPMVVVRLDEIIEQQKEKLRRANNGL